MGQPDDSETKAQIRTLHLTPLDASQVPVVYATNSVIQWTGRDFLISFMQARPPITERDDQLPDEIPAAVMARVVMPFESWQSTLASFVDHFNRLQQQLETNAQAATASEQRGQ